MQCKFIHKQLITESGDVFVPMADGSRAVTSVEAEVEASPLESQQLQRDSRQLKPAVR